MTTKTATSTNVLVTLGALLTLGGVMRLMPNAIATANETSTAGGDRSEPGALAVATGPRGSTAQICFTGETAALLEADQLRLGERAAALRDRELAAEATRKELDQLAADLSAVQQTLERRWTDIQKLADEDVQHLANMYSAMKPSEAASIFNQMDPDFAAGFLRLIPSEQAGLILSNIEASKAYIISVNLANSNSDVSQVN